MDIERLCSLLGDVDVNHLDAGFGQLLSLFPETSCEAIQLINVMLPLTMDLMRPFYAENVLTQINLYLYTKVRT